MEKGPDSSRIDSGLVVAECVTRFRHKQERGVGKRELVFVCNVPADEVAPSAQYQHRHMSSCQSEFQIAWMVSEVNRCLGFAHQPIPLPIASAGRFAGSQTNNGAERCTKSSS